MGCETMITNVDAMVILSFSTRFGCSGGEILEQYYTIN